MCSNMCQILYIKQILTTVFSKGEMYYSPFSTATVTATKAEGYIHVLCSVSKGDLVVVFCFVFCLLFFVVVFTSDRRLLLIDCISLK